jgi:hypothetical protein
VEDPDLQQTGERWTGTGNLVVGRACLGIFRGLLACLLLRARRGAVGGSIAASHLPTVGRALACPAVLPHLLPSQIYTHLYFLSTAAASVRLGRELSRSGVREKPGGLVNVK